MRESRIKRQARESSTKMGNGNLDYVIYYKYTDQYGDYDEAFSRVYKGHKAPDGIPASRIVEKVIYKGGEAVA